MQLPRLGLALAAALLLAGCSQPFVPAPPQAGTAVPVWDAVPRTECAPDRSADGTSASLAPLGFLDDGGSREELDTAVVAGRTLLAASYASADSLEFWDVTDPLSPTPAGAWTAEATDFNDDFKFLPGATGIVVVGDTLRILDTRDLADVRLESTYELGGAPVQLLEKGHTVQAWAVANATYVSIAKAEGGDVSVFRVDGAPGGRTLERVAHLGATPISAVPNRPEPARSHDTWFEVDPQTGTPMLWVANVDWGVVGYDVSDPSAPRLVSTMLPDAENPLVGYVHTVQVTHVDGRRLVVGAQEYESGVLKVWDATDLAAPRLVGYYHVPLVTTSFHNMQVVGPYVFATHFHEGLFVFDLREVPATDGPAAMMQVFAHVPAAGDLSGPRVPVGRAQSYAGTYEVVVRDGLLWTIEVGAGIRTFAFGCLAPGDASATSNG